MKSKDLQKIVFSKYQNGDGPTKIHRDLSGGLSFNTVKRWCKMIKESGAIELFNSPGRPRIIRTPGAIEKVEHRMNRRKRVSVRKLSCELDISRASIRRILREDLGCHPYKKTIEPALSDTQKAQRKRFANWVRTYFRKEETMRILFSDEKMFDIDGVYNSQNDRVWAPSRTAANWRGGIRTKRKFPTKVMVWLGACSKGVTPLVIFQDGTVDHARYIKEVLPVALKYGNHVFGSNWTFQQDGARPHTHHLTQQWCRDHFPVFLDQHQWPPNSPDLNPLDYCIWDELVQAIKWDKVASKTTLIDELRRASKKIRLDVVFESCDSWTTRLSRMAESEGDYLQ